MQLDLLQRIEKPPYEHARVSKVPTQPIRSCLSRSLGKRPELLIDIWYRPALCKRNQSQIETRELFAASPGCKNGDNPFSVNECCCPLTREGLIDVRRRIQAQCFWPNITSLLFPFLSSHALLLHLLCSNALSIGFRCI